MASLKDIPPDKLEEIRKFIHENWGKYPLRSKAGLKTFSDIIEEKFGVRLSPRQISAIRKGVQRVSLKLPVDLLKELEEEFSSVSKGLKILLREYQLSLDLPEWLRPIHRKLANMERVPMGKFSEIVKPMLPEGKTVWDVIRELSRRDLMRRDGNEWIIFRTPKNPFIGFV